MTTTTIPATAAAIWHSITTPDEPGWLLMTFTGIDNPLTPADGALRITYRAAGVVEVIVTGRPLDNIGPATAADICQRLQHPDHHQ